MPSSHLILGHPFLLLPPIPPASESFSDATQVTQCKFPASLSGDTVFDHQMAPSLSCGPDAFPKPVATFDSLLPLTLTSQMALVVKKLPAKVGDIKDTGSIPGLGRSPGKGNGNPLQYFCLENPMDRGAWWATVHGSQIIEHN